MPVVAPVRSGQKAPKGWKPLPYMNEYVDELTAQERARRYITTVEAGLGHFATFCMEEGIKHPEEIERKHILRFQSWLLNHDWKVSYRQQLMKYVRGWINWLERVKYIPSNPWFHIKVGVTPKKPNPLTDDELAMLFDAHRRGMYSTAPFFFHRREVILTFLYAWGLRIHELENLNCSQLDVRRDTVVVRQKGGTTKELPYDAMMKDVYMRWSNVRAKFGKVGEDALIIDQQGQRLSDDMMRKIVVDLGKGCGMDIHPHMLRDTCGTNLLDSDMPVERVQKILGHATIRQTLAYSKVNQHKVNESHAKAMNPRLSRLLRPE